jgi:hypothetical protein
MDDGVDVGEEHAAVPCHTWRCGTGACGVHDDDDDDAAAALESLQQQRGRGKAVRFLPRLCEIPAQIVHIAAGDSRPPGEKVRPCYISLARILPRVSPALAVLRCIQ